MVDIVYNAGYSCYEIELGCEGHVMMKGQFFVTIDGEEYPLSNDLLTEKGAPHTVPVIELDKSVDDVKLASGIPAITQRTKFKSDLMLKLRAEITTSEEGFPAELNRDAQEKFPLIWNTVGGPSRGLRNDCVYDRKWDWLSAQFQTTPAHK